jgi:glycosyltransferase involved in cell wall biosynthesis
VDIVFDNATRLIREFGSVKYEIVGSGPDEIYFKARAKKSKINTKFYGYLEGDSFNDVLRECTIGIATYTSDAGNVSQYGDPGKIKRYLSLGIPIITTDLIEFAEEIERSGAGIVVDYNNGEAFIEAVNKIMKNQGVYSKNAYKLSQKFYYRKIYPKMFDTI